MCCLKLASLVNLDYFPQITRGFYFLKVTTRNFSCAVHFGHLTLVKGIIFPITHQEFPLQRAWTVGWMDREILTTTKPWQLQKPSWMPLIQNRSEFQTDCLTFSLAWFEFHTIPNRMLLSIQPHRQYQWGEGHLQLWYSYNLQLINMVNGLIPFKFNTKQRNIKDRGPVWIWMDQTC